MEHQFIQTPQELLRWCEQLRSCQAIALDTEFVGESSYQPELCLVQVEAGGRLALLDPLAVNLQPFWELLVSHAGEIIVHAGVQDMLFCYLAIGKMPSVVVDVQIAAGLIGMEYPAGFSTLMGRLLGRSFPKAETRTDWRHRPLSSQQIEYALEDVLYLRELWAALRSRLEQMGRLEWFYEEMDRWKTEAIQKTLQEGWRRLPGQSGLSRRGLAVLRELWQWREKHAQRRNCPARFVLRDDLLVELARRETANIHRICAVRGLHHPGLQKHLPQIAACIDRALHLREDQLPQPSIGASIPVFPILAQFLYAALTTRCREAHVAPSLVGSPNDIREWIAYRLRAGNSAEVPLLERGWRAQLMGSLLQDLLAGKLAIRIRDPKLELPLEWVSLPDQTTPSTLFSEGPKVSMSDGSSIEASLPDQLSQTAPSALLSPGPEENDPHCQSS